MTRRELFTKGFKYLAGMAVWSLVGPRLKAAAPPVPSGPPTLSAASTTVGTASTAKVWTLAVTLHWERAHRRIYRGPGVRRASREEMTWTWGSA